MSTESSLPPWLPTAHRPAPQRLRRGVPDPAFRLRPVRRGLSFLLSGDPDARPARLPRRRLRAHRRAPLRPFLTNPPPQIRGEATEGVTDDPGLSRSIIHLSRSTTRISCTAGSVQQVTSQSPSRWTDACGRRDRVAQNPPRETATASSYRMPRCIARGNLGNMRAPGAYLILGVVKP